MEILILDDLKKQRTSIRLAKILLTFGGLSALFFMTGHPWVGGFYVLMGVVLISLYKDD